MVDARKIDWQNVNYVWTNFSLYGKVKGLKIYEMQEGMKTRLVKDEALMKALIDSPQAEVQAMMAEELRYKNGEKIVLFVIEDGDRTYLSERGAVHYLKDTYGVGKEQSAEYIARIATRRKFCLIGDALCMGLMEKEPTINDYEEMIIFLWKIQKFGGYGYV